MKFSSWLFTRSTPDRRAKMAVDLAYVMEVMESYQRFTMRDLDTVTDLYIHLMNVRGVLSREREYQLRDVGVYLKSVEPELVTHLDRNVLRIMSDKQLRLLTLFYKDNIKMARERAKDNWLKGDGSMAKRFKAERIRYEQAFIKLKREHERRALVYNLK